MRTETIAESLAASPARAAYKRVAAARDEWYMTDSAERQARLVQYGRAVYNATLARLEREPYMFWEEDEDLRAILVILGDQMGYDRAVALLNE